MSERIIFLKLYELLELKRRFYGIGSYQSNRFFTYIVTRKQNISLVIKLSVSSSPTEQRNLFKVLETHPSGSQMFEYLSLLFRISLIALQEFKYLLCNFASIGRDLILQGICFDAGMTRELI